MSSKSVFDEVYGSKNLFDKVYGAPSQNQPKEPLQTQITRTAAQVPQALLQMTTPGLVAEGLNVFGKGEALAGLEEDFSPERIAHLKQTFPSAPWEEFEKKYPTHDVFKQKYLEGLEAAQKTFPTVSNIASAIEKSTGIPLEPKSDLDKTIRFISEIASIKPGAATQKVGAGLKAESMKNLLETVGVPKGVSDALAAYFGLRTKTPEVKVHPAEKPKKPIQKEEPIFPERGAPPAPGAPSGAGPSPTEEIERLPSGLSKPRAMESTTTKFATINPERQKYAIKNLNEEATQLTKKSVEKHLPLAEEIKKGTDFQTSFDKEFEQLSTIAKKYNPEIDITPISRLLSETRSKYKGIPSPHKDVIKIKNEMKRFAKNPQTGMYNLLKIYRSNNRKQRDIFETSRLTGKQQEYSDFLSAFNRAISKSFSETLPADSAWVSRFLKNNKDYKKYIDTKTAMRLLEPLLEGQITSARINALARDPRLHKKLELSMGKAGAAEVIQIAKDLKASRESIKNLPKEKVHALDAVFPIGFLIPFLKIPTLIYKGVKFSRSLYGYWLSSPAKRKAVDSAVKALSEGDVSAYKTATETLKEDIKSD